MLKSRSMDLLFGIINCFISMQFTMQYMEPHVGNVRLDSDSSLTIRDLNHSIVYAQKIIEQIKRLETSLGWSEIHIQTGSPSHGQLIESQPENEALNEGKNALVAIQATTHLVHKHCANHNLKDCIKYISQYRMQSTPLEKACPLSKKRCTHSKFHSKFRAIDGSCNNFRNPLQGVAFSSYKRLLPANYGDDLQDIRRSVYVEFVLPSPRLVSTTLNKNQNMGDGKLTLAVMQWGQFVEHDMAFTATSTMIHFKKTIECCNHDGTSLSPRYVHPLCASISIPLDDPFYSKFYVTCIPYIRSVAAINSDCSFGPLEQLNQASHFLDGSQIYGTDNTKFGLRRQFHDGLLRYRGHKNMFLLKSSNPVQDCQHNDLESTCYISGDSRVNMLPDSALMHTLWLRQHNRIAQQLKFINPHWDDEELFEETRRIVIAMLQHITYNEWLPIILGSSNLEKVNSQPGYSEKIDSRTSNSFATAALKFTNSLIDDHISIYDENRIILQSYNLRKLFHRPSILEESDNFDGMIRGLATQKSKKLDLDYVEDITNHYYQNGLYGYDVFSLDIQRGRDHGLPSYVAFRSLIGYPNITDFSDLSDVIPEEKIRLLEVVYKSPLDIDLLVGGMSETPLSNSLLGPTFTFIIGEQMWRTKNGDRYFYTNNVFTHEQLKEIQKVTLARIFCDNGNDIQFMQPQVFKQISNSNGLVSCQSETIPHVNLKLWISRNEGHHIQ